MLQGEGLADQGGGVRHRPRGLGAAAADRTTSTSTGHTNRLHPGCPSGSQSDNGSGHDGKPTNCTVNGAPTGMPVPRARHVPPSHGRDTPVSCTVPPLPVQPIPNGTCAAGHADASCSRYGDVMLPWVGEERVNAPSHQIWSSRSSAMVYRAPPRRLAHPTRPLPS